MSVPNISSIKTPTPVKDAATEMIMKAMKRKLIMTGLTIAIATTLIAVGNHMDKNIEPANEDQN